VIRRGRVLSGALLLSALIVVALTAGAQANHSSLDVLSQGTIGGTDPFVPFFPLGGSSIDGEHAFFETDEQLLPSDMDTSFDVYERFAGSTSRVSFGSTGGNADPTEVFFKATSNDGSHAFFTTDEQLEPTDGDNQIDLYDRFAGNTTLVSDGAGATGDGPYEVFFDAISTDGSTAFFTTAESLVPSDTDNCAGAGCDDVYQRSGGTTTLVSAGGTAAQHATFRGGSSDGSRIFFETPESLSGSDTDAKIDVYERSGGTTTLVSTGTPGNGPYDAFFAGTSSDGLKVFFTTRESLAGSDMDDCNPGAPVDGCIDVYERSSGTTTRVSAGTPGNGAFHAAFDANSEDGSRVFFNTDEQLATGDSDGATDVYQRFGGSTTRISTGSAGGNGATFNAAFEGASTDGTRVFFSTAEKLENPPDTDNFDDVYRRVGSTTTLMSIGSTGGNGAIPAYFDGNSQDGNRVFFSTDEKLENPPDTDNSFDIYERSSGGASLISIGPNGGNGGQDAFFEHASGDGTHVFFTSDERLRNPPDSDNSTDIYDAEAPVGYARPTSATPTNLALVPAFEDCTSPDGSHGAPLNSGSCNPPVPTSGFLTVGAPDVTGTPANSRGSISLKVLGESPIDDLNGDQADVQFQFQLSDVKNQASPFSDYIGEVRGVIGVRITDRHNGPTLTAPATVSDLDIGFTAVCAPVGGPQGSSCNVTTTLDTLSGGTVRENRRSVWELKQFKVFDGGPDGDVDTANNTLFMVQGTFAP
jgi:hypothetical protein